jgi:hypothetical protein
MSLLDSIKSGVSRAIWKGVKHAGTAIAGFGATFLLNKLHFQLSADHQIAVAVAITGALGTILKMLKDRFPKQLGWL